MEKKIVLLPGDGIGPEIMNSAKAILSTIEQLYNHTFHTEQCYFGGIAIDVIGNALPQETLVACLEGDAILLGAVGGPKWDRGEERPEKGLLGLRKALNVFANVRPVKVTEVLADVSPLKSHIVKDVDFVVVRELTGGLYFGEPKYRIEDKAVDTLMYTRAEIERIVEYSFKLAQKRKNLVTSVDKANVLESSKLWREVVEEVATHYPDVQIEHILVDAAAMELIRRPSRFDVLVTENMFGDILSDEASMVTGSLGMLPSGSYSDGGPALYEPIHGSAPDIAGKGIANPSAMLFSVSMMLFDFGLYEESKLIEASIQSVLENEKRTADLGGNCSTEEFTNYIIEQMTCKFDQEVK
ncbi:MAG: 3-isopropylmalate dehydrogenase [Bacillaceae bacterium]